MDYKHLSIHVKFMTSIMVIFVLLGLGVVILGVRFLSSSTISRSETLFNDLIDSYAENIETGFEESMRHGEFLAAEIARWYSEAQSAQWNEEFSNKFYFDQDRALRTRETEGEIWGAFMSQRGQFNHRVKRMLVALNDKIGDYQHAASVQFLNTYVLMPEDLTVMDNPALMREIPPDFSILDQEFFTVALPENNPDGKSVWTSMYYDPFLDYWMISNATPISDGREFLGSVGHDIPLNDILASLSKFQESIADSQHIIMTASGSFIYHPEYEDLMNTSPESYDYQGRSDLGLLNAIRQHDPDQGTPFSARINYEDAPSILTARYMPSVDWYYVQLVPERSLLSNVRTLSHILIVGTLAILLIIAGALFWSTHQIIVKPLRKGVEVANQLAEGNLVVKVDVSNQDEVGQLLLAMQRMIAKLNEIVIDVNHTAGLLTSSSQKMSSSSAAMSQGATEQAASSEEASAAMQQISANIHQNTDNAMQTEQIAVQAARDAEMSGQAVADAVVAMQQIAKKISVVEDIANRTHILSMNASIEASKAQEYGKGFAVVASEVRTLAIQSEAAAKEISEFVLSSVELAEEAGNMLNTLVPGIQRTAELIQEISAASREQNSGVSQVNTAIQQLDEVTQHTSITAEELSQTADVLATQAEHLQATIEFFTIPEEPSARARDEWTTLLEKLQLIPDDDAKGQLLAAITNIFAAIERADHQETTAKAADPKERKTNSAASSSNSGEDPIDLNDDDFERY